MSDEPYTIPVRRVPLWQYVGFFAVLAAAGVLIIVFAGGFFRWVGGGFLILVLPWALVLRRQGLPGDLRIDRDGISTPQWRLAWPEIDDVRVGVSPNGLQRLEIRPHDPTAVARQYRTRFLRANARLNAGVDVPIGLPTAVLQRPVDEILAVCREKSGRDFA